jgi:uncharacterized membrane protein YeaQ/YmgE (transglycosylase-associated protein family)
MHAIVESETIEAKGPPPLPPHPSGHGTAIHIESCPSAEGRFKSWGGRNMSIRQVGWLAAIIVGGMMMVRQLFMKSNMGILTSIVFGIVGAAVATAVLAMVDVSLGDWGLSRSQLCRGICPSRSVK